MSSPTPRSDTPQSDPFSLLSLPASFDLTPAQVQSAYLRLAPAHHPDLIRDPLAQADAARQSAALNLARQTLLNPESRANALHLLFGGPVKEQNTSLPPNFLLSIMQARELLESALASGSPAELQQCEAWALDQRQRYISRAREAFQKIRDIPPSPRRTLLLADLRTHFNAWRYIERMIDQLHPEHD